MSLRQHAVPFLALLAASFMPGTGVAQQGDFWAGIEVGSRTTKAVVIEIFPQGSREDYKVKEFQEVNTALGSGVVNKKFSQEAINQTADAVVTLHNGMLAKHGTNGLKSDRFYVIASSGVKSRGTNISDLAKRIAELLPDVRKLDPIEAKDEIGYTIRGTIPSEDLKDALSIDIGGGNTKYGFVRSGWHDIDTGSVSGSGALASAISEKLRDKQFQNDSHRHAEFHRAAKEKFQEELSNWRTNKTDGFERRRKIYLTGGIPYVLVTMLQFTKNDSGDIEIENPDNAFGAFRDRVLGADPYVPTKGGAPDQFLQLKQNFPQDHLIAGSAILDVLAAEKPFELKSKSLRFSTKGLEAFISRYVFEQRRVESKEPVPRREFSRAIDEIREEVDKTSDQIRQLGFGLKDEIGKIATQDSVNALREHLKQEFQESLKDAAKLKDITELRTELENLSRRIPPPTDISGLVAEVASLRRQIEEGVEYSKERVDTVRAWSHFQRGMELYHKGNLEYALISLDTATRIDRNEPVFWYALALTHERMGLPYLSRNAASRVADAILRKDSVRADIAIEFEKVQGPTRRAIDSYVSEVLDPIKRRTNTSMSFGR